MKIEETQLKGCFIITPNIFHDDRGFFFESYSSKVFNKLIGEVQFVQDNQSYSRRGVLRGLHFQNAEYAQAKLVQVTRGSVLDVCVDLRETSPTFGKHIAIELSEENKKQLFIPKGFAHGFLVLENNTVFSYKCDNYYNKNSEKGIIYNDETLNIDWNFSKEDIIISEKDLQLPTFESLFT
ncbi:dTDP-4-dehydrorhamnose 3,5-epimerase [Flavobacteriaceae bacterium AU392]|nr:dTDP-4-dehydrorhamnose 3,5-epimerase [Flavobacteriaceae bacterium]RKM84854.1 dTDP-4-dehydrorhamnose 3,5-epimerase [Flavobacteriaceae bacterium AU392]